MSNNLHDKSHLWIPNEEVISLPNKKMGMTTPRNVIHSEHGSKLSSNLKSIIERHEQSHIKSSLRDEDLIIFKVNLPDGEKLDNSQRQKLLNDNGLQINTIKNRRTAIVSTTSEKFRRLQNRISQYQSSGKLADFQYLDNFDVVSISDKETNTIKGIVNDQAKSNTILDVELLLLPNLGHTVYSNILPRLITIVQSKGSLLRSPYFLSDGTPIIRASVEVSSINEIAEDEAIYRIEQTNFFQPIISNITGDLTNLEVEGNIVMESLPKVVVMDTGIDLPLQMKHLVVDKWVPHQNPLLSKHGTEVASKILFADLGFKCKTKAVLNPRAAVIDIPIFDNDTKRNSDIDMIERIKLAVEKYHSISKIFNLSLNSAQPIEGDEISIMGYELDNLMNSYNIQFVISAGNHTLYTRAKNLDEIIDDDDNRIASPADSMLGITVGSVVGFNHENSISKRNEVAPYSRIGPGFAGYTKPDLVAYSGTVVNSNGHFYAPPDEYAMVISNNNVLCANAGTSFSAPIVAGDFAEVCNYLKNDDLLLAKTLLFHSAEHIIDIDGIQEDELEAICAIYGKGIANPEKAKYSSNSKVTFVRTGKMTKNQKERVKFYMPTIIAAQKGRNLAKVTVTCMSKPPFDRTKGDSYLGAYIHASLHKYRNNDKLPSANPSSKNGRKKWDMCFHFSNVFSSFHAGDWQLWLELFTRWDVPENFEVPYSLAITIEDLSGSLDLYSSIMNEAKGRYIPMNELTIEQQNRLQVR